jgi:transcriptional regulator with XRE-family HTH domain|tara:strand:+ start:235 stop:495 length:261 start_codon:yes stop_codon:yes gene_type:complete
MSRVTRLEPAGRKLAELRYLAGLTQQQAAEACGVKVQFISQIETGRERLPGRAWAPLAKVYGVPSKRLGMLLLRFYEPEMHKALFG